MILKNIAKISMKDGYQLSMKICKSIVIVYNTKYLSHYKMVIDKWYPLATQTNKDSILALVAFDRESEEHKEVDNNEARKFAEEHNMIFKIVSCETYKNIDELFQEVVEKLYQKYHITRNEIVYINDKTKRDKEYNKEHCYLKFK